MLSLVEKAFRSATTEITTVIPEKFKNYVPKRRLPLEGLRVAIPDRVSTAAFGVDAEKLYEILNAMGAVPFREKEGHPTELLLTDGGLTSADPARAITTFGLREGISVQDLRLVELAKALSKEGGKSEEILTPVAEKMRVKK